MGRYNDDLGKEIPPVTADEKVKLRRECMKNAIKPNGSVDMESIPTKFYGYIVHPSPSDLIGLSSSNSDSGSESSYDRDLIFLYPTPGSNQNWDPRFSTTLQPLGNNVLLLRSVDMDNFSEEVFHFDSLIFETYINLLQSKGSISSTGREEDIIISLCTMGDKVFLQRPKGR